jgi:hypothetical protein
LFLNQETTPATEVATGITEDQAATEFLKKWGVSDDEPSPEAEPEEELPDAEADEASEQEDDDAEEKAEGSGEIEIDVAGEKFKLPPAVAEQAKRIEAKAKEVEAGATRKFQEAADLRKAAELTATQATQQQHFNQAQAHLLGEHTLVTRRMQLFEQMNLSAYADDPVGLTKINAEYNQLRGAKERLEQELHRVHGLFTKDQEGIKAQRFQAAAEYAKANIKDWGTDGGKRHANYATKLGFQTAEIESLLIQDPRLFKILEDAEYGARVRASKPDRNKLIADTAKTLKPGAGGQSKLTAANAAKQANERLAKTGRVEDAALALLARSKRR